MDAIMERAAPKTISGPMQEIHPANFEEPEVVPFNTASAYFFVQYIPSAEMMASFDIKAGRVVEHANIDEFKAYIQNG